MDDARILELIHRELDADLSSAEQAELARRLLQDPEARQLRETLRQTDRRLKSVPQAEPPAGLRRAILSAVRLPGDGSRGQSGTVGGRPALRYAAIVAGAILIAGLGYQLLDSGRPQPGLEGSVAAPALAAAAIGKAEMAFDAGTVRARLLQTGDGARLEIDSDTTQDVTLVVRFDPSLMGYLDGAGTGGIAQDGRLTLTPGTGRQQQTIDFDGLGPIRLEVTSGGETVAEASLPDN